MTVRRYDSVSLGKPRFDSRGFLVAPAALTRTGVFKYTLGDGTVVRELRHPDEVFKPESLDTLKAAPITRGHPAGGMVTPQNAGSLEIGVVGGDVSKDGEFVASELSFRREDAIKAVMDKELQELSCGYTCDIDATPGEFEGERYDQAQTNIRYNHVAALPYGSGRAGRDVRIRLDSADGVEVTGEPESPSKGKTTNMAKLRLDGLEFEVPENLVPLVDKKFQELKAEADAAKEAAKAAEQRADALEGERDALKGKLDEASKPVDVDALVERRIALRERAAKMAGSALKLDGLTELEIMKAALAKAAPELKLDDKSEQYVQAAFDLMADNAASAAAEDTAAASAARADSTENEPEASPLDAAWESRAKMGHIKESK